MALMSVSQRLPAEVLSVESASAGRSKGPSPTPKARLPAARRPKLSAPGSAGTPANEGVAKRHNQTTAPNAARQNRVSVASFPTRLGLKPKPTSATDLLRTDSGVKIRSCDLHIVDICKAAAARRFKTYAFDSGSERNLNRCRCAPVSPIVGIGKTDP
jgi:hypothetical protein